MNTLKDVILMIFYVQIVVHSKSLMYLCINKKEIKQQLLKIKIMTIEQLKPQDQDGIIGKIISICNQVKYLNSEIVPFYSEMEKWEQKEYKELLQFYKEELKELSEYMIKDLNFWNERLGYYHTSTAVFLQATAYQYK